MARQNKGAVVFRFSGGDDFWLGLNPQLFGGKKKKSPQRTTNKIPKKKSGAKRGKKTKGGTTGGGKKQTNPGQTRKDKIERETPKFFLLGNKGWARPSQGGQGGGTAKTKKNKQKTNQTKTFLNVGPGAPKGRGKCYAQSCLFFH